ncbi:MAG: TrkH family potassium uptake protein [Eubacterium sp.]|nr:TrkH family potassium uptake protein [Eubacterium sp.]
MNHKVIIYTIGLAIQMTGLLLILPIITGIVYHERETFLIIVYAAIAFLVGALLTMIKPGKKAIRAKEGFVITALSWIVLSVVGAIPFVLCGYIPSITDAVFETASGFTTTGASILTDIESMPRCLLMWRSFTHWIGGMGILVFMLIFIPSNADEMNIMRAESPGPSVEKIVPRVRETALTLYTIYTVMTLALIIILVLAGMPVFDSICHAFGAAGTGGFGIKSDSITSYSTACQNILTVGMIMFGVNFNVYYLIIMKRYKSLLSCEEVIWYLIIYIVTSITVALGVYQGFTNLIGIESEMVFTSFPKALQQSFFQVASIMTTTGYATADFNKWSSMSKTIMVAIMFVGACAGSTGGGMKVSRWILYFKQIKRELQSYIHPNSVKTVRLDGKSVDQNVLRTTNVYLMAYMFVYLFSLIVVSFDRYDVVTSFTAVAATINNIGPGLGEVGPTGGFSGFSILSKWVFIFDMIAGRLELVPVLIMLSPSTWRKK